MRWLPALLLLAACEVPLDPIEPSDLVYSLSGYLDASADTQWVRVEPFDRTAALDPGLIDATVSLEGAGLEVELEQEVRAFVTGPAHLFWTTAGVDPGREYRLRARRSDGAEATAAIEIPDTTGVDVQVAGIDRFPPSCPIVASVQGAEDLADVRADYFLLEGDRVVRRSVSYFPFIGDRTDGSLQVSLYPGTDLRLVAPQGTDTSVIVVAITNAGWPDVAGLSFEDLLQFQAPGLDRAVGYVGGVVTRRFPFRADRRCTDPRRDG
ncbi:hypothetical protein [Rubrivirga sp.]|uniref:hypothetical protein n=1 Tax=Rubrivirga sp. TaxID=1885344 RepID=UPI003C73E2B7